MSPVLGVSSTGPEITIIHIFEDRVIAKSVYTIKEEYQSKSLQALVSGVRPAVVHNILCVQPHAHFYGIVSRFRCVSCVCTRVRIKM